MEDDHITIIIASSTKEIKRIGLRKNTLKYLKLAFWTFILLFIILIGSVIYLSKSNSFLKSRIVALEQSDIRRAQEEQLKRMIEANEKTMRKAAFDSLKAGKIGDLREVNSEEVNISEIIITKSDSIAGVQISFKLNNVKMTNTISGYVILLGFHYKFEDNLYVTYPPLLQLNDDYTPVNYREGESFAIQYYKLVNANLRPPTLMESIDFIVVNIYSRDGTILLRNMLNTHDYIDE